MTKYFQVQADKTINDPQGNRAKIIMIDAFHELFTTHEATRANWNIRSAPSGYAPFVWRNPGYVTAFFASYAALGFNGVRIGVEAPVWTQGPYTDTFDGQVYPSELNMLDVIISAASEFNFLVILTGSNAKVPKSVSQAFFANLATRYATNGHVAFNPENEINCGTGGPYCLDANQWAIDQAAYINAIRTTGAGNLIVLNPTNGGFSMAPIVPKISSAPFSTDPNLCYAIHNYIFGDGNASTTFGAAEQAAEMTEWGNYLGTYPIIIEESGISADEANTYDPDMDGLTSHDLTKWGYMKAYQTGFLQFCKTKMDTNKLSGIGVFGDHLWIKPLNLHNDNAIRRKDGTWTPHGLICRSALSNSAAGGWTAYIPTFSAESGSFASANATGSYQRIGNSVLFRAQLNIVTNGTAATRTHIGVPFPAVAGGRHILVGRETGITGNGLNCAILESGTFAYVSNLTNGYVGGNGYQLSITGIYECVP